MKHTCKMHRFKTKQSNMGMNWGTLQRKIDKRLGCYQHPNPHKKPLIWSPHSQFSSADLQIFTPSRLLFLHSTSLFLILECHQNVPEIFPEQIFFLLIHVENRLTVFIPWKLKKWLKFHSFRAVSKGEVAICRYMFHKMQRDFSLLSASEPSSTHSLRMTRF